MLPSLSYSGVRSAIVSEASWYETSEKRGRAKSRNEGVARLAVGEAPILAEGAGQVGAGEIGVRPACLLDDLSFARV